MANGNPSPGWYQDPRDPAQVRWWDGGGWTQNTQPMPGAAQPEVPQTPAAPEPSFDDVTVVDFDTASRIAARIVVPGISAVVLPGTRSPCQ